MNERISAFLAERIAANDFPSAVYLVAERGEIVFHDALGNAVVTPVVIPARLDTIYDLASLTKPLVTGLLAASKIEGGEIGLDTTLGSASPYFDGSAVSDLTLRQLATHTSGLPSWIPLYLEARSNKPKDIAVVIDGQGLRTNPEVDYSDLNFISLAYLMGDDWLDWAFDHSVVDRLGFNRTSFDPLSQGIARIEIAASEMGNEYEKQTCIEKGYLPSQVQKPDREGGRNIDFDSYALTNARASANLRTRQIWGEVHDGNAYFLGGIAGHAGLFSTAEEVFKIALQFLPEYTNVLKPETCELFRTNFTPGMNEDRSFAFQLASTKDSTAGTRMSPESFGHNGFTGTSLWIDPAMDRIFVLLTNRTHAHPLPFVNINSVRRRFHDLAIEELQKK